MSKLQVVVIILLVAVSAFAQESPLQIAASLTPLPVIVIPDESYRWEAKLIAEKLAELKAEMQERVVVYFTKKENLFKEVKIESEDKGKYLLQSKLSYPENASWNPNEEGEGIEALGGGYAIYNDFYISDYKDGEVTITPVYYILELDKKVGKIITIKGEKYIVLEYNSSKKYAKLAKAKEVKLYRLPSLVEYKLWSGRGIRIANYVKPGNKSGSAILMPTLNGANMGSVLVSISNSTPQEITEELREYFPGYYIYITEAGDDYISLAFAEKSGEVVIYNGESALGYSTTWLPRTIAGHANSIVFAGKAVTLGRHGSAQLEATPYYLRLSNYYLSIAKQGLLGSFVNGSTLKFAAYRNHLKGDVNISIEGDGVKLEYFTNELDDSTDEEDDFRSTKCEIDQFLVRNCSAAHWRTREEGLKMDGDGDGKLSGSKDYVKYNDLLVWDRRHGYIEIIPVKIVNISENSLITIEGNNYYVIKSRIPDSITLMRAREIKLYSMPRLLIDYGIEAVDGLRFVVSELHISGANVSFNLFMIKNGTLLNTFIIRNVTIGEELGEVREYINRRVFLMDAADNYIKLVVQTGEVEEVYDKEPWLGYKSVEMRLYSLNSSEIALFGTKIGIKDGESKKINNTQFYVVYRDRKIDVVRKKSLKVKAGERLDATLWPWRDFLKDDLTFFISEEVIYPEVEVKLAKGVGGKPNLILLGMVEEHPLIRKLVKQNLSKVKWNKSDGNIEVIKTSGNSTVIIISGKDRKAVERAVEGFVKRAIMEYIEMPEDEEEKPREISGSGNFSEIKIEKNETGTSINATQNKTVNSSNLGKESQPIRESFLGIVISEIIRFIGSLLGGNK